MALQPEFKGILWSRNKRRNKLKMVKFRLQKLSCQEKG